MSELSPVTLSGDGVRVALRVTPRAGRDRIDGIVADADGRAALKLSVTAAPEDGKANMAVLKLLAKAWGVPRTALSVASGAGARRKIVHVAGDGQALARRINAWLGEQHG